MATLDVLLIRPDPGNERFGLGPFFLVEPLGLEYVAASLRSYGARPIVVDERCVRFGDSRLRRMRPRIVGLSCMHALEYDRVLEVARRVRRLAPEALIVVGGHAASAYRVPLETHDVDAICTDDGERVMPELVASVSRGGSLGSVPGLSVRTREGWVDGPRFDRDGDLNAVPLPARDLVAPYRRRYHCLLFKPVWLVETARGCPFRCSFCSVWPQYHRTIRERSVGIVVDDLASVGPNVFLVDDLFWNHPDRSLALAAAVRARGIRKRWVLAQTRTDLVVRHPELLEAWRPIAQDFDIFFGFESPSDGGLDRLSKDSTVRNTVEAARIARSLGYGVTGNFVVDPDWDERDFETLWEFVAEHRLDRAGYTILTPLPGTEMYRERAASLHGHPWFKFDMHHALWEPRLGAERFFELYAETWRRSILNLRGRKRWRDWAVQIRPTQLAYLTRVLWRTQRMMNPIAYLAEHDRAHAVRQEAIS